MSVISKMYGAISKPSPTMDTKKIAEPTKLAVRQLSGLKLSQNHIKQIEIDGKIANLPTAEYIGLLEKQIKELRSDNRRLEGNINRLESANRRIINSVNKIQAALNNKVDNFK